MSVILLCYGRRNLISGMYGILQAESGLAAVFFRRDHALCIIFEIQDHFFFIHADDGTRQDISLIDLFHGIVQFFFVVFHALCSIFGCFCNVHFFCHDITPLYNIFMLNDLQSQ